MTTTATATATNISHQTSPTRITITTRFRRRRLNWRASSGIARFKLQSGIYWPSSTVCLVAVLPLLLLALLLLLLAHLQHPSLVRCAPPSSNGGGGGQTATTRMVRLCIASVDPVKLSSQCVMCNRREFPLTVIDCTGITKVNDLIANPLSVQEATCLIYNCRRQVPDVKPEPYHGSVSHAANYRGVGQASSISYPPPSQAAISMAGSRMYEMMPPSGMFGGYSQASQMPPASGGTSAMAARYGFARFNGAGSTAADLIQPMGPPRGLIGGPSLLAGGGSLDNQQPLPYALVPAPSTFPFGEYK